MRGTAGWTGDEECMMTAAKKKDAYRHTLQLPKTEFSMRANLLQKEPQFQKRWAAMNLYQKIQDREHPAGEFVFHDGPPYANGSIHMGHLLNKILKDLVVRSRSMAGHNVPYVPGWDCHGLPIEHKVMKEIGPEAAELSIMDIRNKCAKYASKFMKLQAKEMLRLGTQADYDHPYFTMDSAYEGAVLEVFAGLVGQGLVYRDLKPVHWSIENRTALADAELEYYDREDTSIFVLFDLEDPAGLPASLGLPEGADASLVIWTTTPWTLPANMAVAAAASADYGLFRFDHAGSTRYAVVAENLREAVLGDGAELLGRCRGEELVGVTYRHPFVERTGRVVTAPYVTLEDGTGLVHTAPGHGSEDYMTGLKEGLEVYCPVQGDGTFDQTVPEWLRDLLVWDANPVIVERLRESGHLLRDERFTHSYPHDWRGKTPTIFRATEQWFIAVDEAFGPEAASLRQRADAAAADHIRFIPDWGRNRLRGMLESRPDWCISRQRSWGLPIPAFASADGEPLLTEATVRAVAKRIREKGSNAWFLEGPADLLQYYDPAVDPAAPDWLKDGGLDVVADLEKGGDIFDVWFESGSSWNAVMRERGIGYPCDLYLEGSDQHRGWFQLSLLPGLGVTGRSPFETVLTHGFMVTAAGQKMSKSLGNAIEVSDLLEEHGADVCRWWVASLSYINDIKVDWEFFRVASDEYRKVRNTIRFMLGNLADFDRRADAVTLGPDDARSVDAWALERFAELVATVTGAYQDYQFKRAREALFTFCNDTMSAVYLAATKDRLYCDAADDRRRRRTQTAMDIIVSGLIRLVAPILVHTADEAWLAYTGADMNGDDCVHLQLLPEAPEVVADPTWTAAMELRAEVLRRIEQTKEGLGVSNPLDLGVAATSPQADALKGFLPELADLCGVSRFTLGAGDPDIALEDLREAPRCERSWKRDGTVAERSDGGWLSERDAEVVGVS
jgi:isoleucyl-tRNA synthetase